MLTSIEVAAIAAGCMIVLAIYLEYRRWKALDTPEGEQAIRQAVHGNFAPLESPPPTPPGSSEATFPKQLLD